MKKISKEMFYNSMGKELTKYRLKKKITISQLATLVDQQYNTVRAIENGRPFTAYQLWWMSQILELPIIEIFNNMKEEDSHGQENNLSDYL